MQCHQRPNRTPASRGITLEEDRGEKAKPSMQKNIKGPYRNLTVTPGRAAYWHRAGGARSEAGRVLPPVSQKGVMAFPFPLPPLRRSSPLSHSSPSVEALSGRPLPTKRAPSEDNLSIRLLSSVLSSSSSVLSSSRSSPSAVSKSGGSIHSRGTTQGNATPMLAARLSQPGPGLPVSLSHR